MRQVTALVAIVSMLDLSACTLLPCIACDGHLGAAGEVYEWLDPPGDAKSVAFIDTKTSNTQRVSPLAGAQIALEPWTPRRRPTAHDATPGRREAITDQDGHFRVAGAVRPGNYAATLSVKAAGFQSVEQVFNHDRQTNHTVRVLLVRTTPGRAR
jgi:hypothetical protein